MAAILFGADARFRLGTLANGLSGESLAASPRGRSGLWPALLEIDPNPDETMKDKENKIPQRQSSYTREELLRCGHGELFGPGNAELPLPPMLMFDRITHIAATGGLYDRGVIHAELDLQPDLWFFACHFDNDPVMPGCLGLDAMWQMVGFYLGWLGGAGRGRALGVGEVKFRGQVLPHNRTLVYRVNLKRVMLRKLVMGIADAEMECDGKIIYEASDLRVGLFTAVDAF